MDKQPTLSEIFENMADNNAEFLQSVISLKGITVSKDFCKMMLEKQSEKRNEVIENGLG